MAQFTVLKALNVGGKRYVPGSTVELGPDQALRLIGLGKVAPGGGGGGGSVSLHHAHLEFWGSGVFEQQVLEINGVASNIGFPGLPPGDTWDVPPGLLGVPIPSTGIYLLGVYAVWGPTHVQTEIWRDGARTHPAASGWVITANVPQVLPTLYEGDELRIVNHTSSEADQTSWQLTRVA